MKIKQSFSVSIRPMLIVFGAASGCCAVIRFIQMLKFIDVNTGFYTGGAIFNVLLLLILASVSLYFVIASFLSKETKNYDLQNLKGTSLGAVSAFFAVSLFGDWIYSFILSGSSLLDIRSLSTVKVLMSSGALPAALQSLFAFISAIFFVVLTVDFFKGTQRASRLKVLAIAPVGWAVMKMIHRFVRQISYMEVSDLFLELVMIAFMIMFFMAFAQINSGVYSDGFTWRLSGFGLPAALVAATLCLPRLILTFVDSRAYINSDHPFLMSDLAFVLFAIMLVITLIRKKSVEAAASEDK